MQTTCNYLNNITNFSDLENLEKHETMMQTIAKRMKDEPQAGDINTLSN